MEKLMAISGKKVILNTQFSKIGYSYYRLFVEKNENEYINIDLTVGGAFKMEKKDFNDWLEDAESIPEHLQKQVCEEKGINYEKLVEYLQEL